ncbi:hypothetical protein DLH72_00715 [Candidatus Gracilibacteria bacterium]|nr:MAG: hypothetical protein DLH72_00715 [Candidatus Gracilibacteria bacterium]
MKKDIYLKVGINSEKKLLNYLTKGENIISSNKNKNFFVNWDNAISFMKNYSEEIHLLNSITEFSDNRLEILSQILDKYENVRKIMPILIAYSYDSVELQLGEPDFLTKEYNFSTTKECIEFLEITGFMNFLGTISSFRDYIFGVKVGMDTNGRKNRSGIFNENIVSKILDNYKHSSNIEIYEQKTFGGILDEKNLEKLPKGYQRKKCDFILKKGNKFINLEVNHFGGGGSKQEIVDAYRTRKKDLEKAGIGFVWNTDGSGWYKVNDEENKLIQAINEIDFITNIKMLKNTKILDYIIKYYFD